MRLSIATVLVLLLLTFTGCSAGEDKEVNLSDLGQQELGATVHTVGYTTFASASVTVDFLLPGSDPSAGVDSDCVRLSADVDVLVNGAPAQVSRGGRTMNTWSGCEPSGSAVAIVDVGTVDVSFTDGTNTRTIQVQFGLPTLGSPADGRVGPGSEAVVRLPTLPALSPSARYSARLYSLGDSPAYDHESSRPEGAAPPIDLEVTRDGESLRVRMPSDGHGTWLMYITHPDLLATYEIPVTRCDFKKCRAALSDFYAVFPGIQVDFIE
jgi:hypothetical protein